MYRILFFVGNLILFDDFFLNGRVFDLVFFGINGVVVFFVDEKLVSIYLYYDDCLKIKFLLKFDCYWVFVFFLNF